MNKLIYIIGAGRSGTTLVDIILGNAENTESLGELNRYPKKNGIPPKRENDSRASVFWKNITEVVNSKGFELSKVFQFQNQYEYHSGIIKYLFGLGSKENLSNYYGYLKVLYAAAFGEIDNRVMVDSSKYPGRAYHISKALTDVEVCYLYIKREPRSVVEAFQKQGLEQPSKGWLASNIYYLTVNILCKIVCNILAKKHKVLELKYEALLEQPQQNLTLIEDVFQLNLEDVKSKIINEQPIKVGQKMFDGNRIRLQQELIVQQNKPKTFSGIKNIITKLLNSPCYG